MGQTIAEKLWADGRDMGELNKARAILLRQGRKKFGEPDPASLATLQAIVDQDRLDQLAERLLDVSSWSALLGEPTS